MNLPSQSQESNKAQIADIILIENNIDDAALTIRSLKRGSSDTKIIHLKDGAEALEYFFDINGKPNVLPGIPKIILLDLDLPKLSGFTVLERLKSNLYLKVIPIVILSSLGEPVNIKKCYELGVNSYIIKPVSFDAFSKTIEETCRYWTIYNQTSTPE
jgi:two-component system response regulator